MNSLSLRDRKKAQQKIALMQEFVASLEGCKFHDIVIKQVCQKVDVSEGTFYNYFPQKTDVLKFFKEVTVIDILWELEAQSFGSILDKINAFFDLIVDKMINYKIFQEIMAVFCCELSGKCFYDLSEAEIRIIFDDRVDLERLVHRSFEDFFMDSIGEAVIKQELSQKTDIASVAFFLNVILVGTPISLKIYGLDDLKKCFHQQVSLLWRGLK